TSPAQQNSACSPRRFGVRRPVRAGRLDAALVVARKCARNSRLCKRNSFAIKKMEVVHFKGVALAGLCMSFAIKDWRFWGVLGGFKVPLSLSYIARMSVRVIEF